MPRKAANARARPNPSSATGAGSSCAGEQIGIPGHRSADLVAGRLARHGRRRADGNRFEGEREYVRAEHGAVRREQIKKRPIYLVGTEFEGEECGGTEIVFEAIDAVMGGMDEEDPGARPSSNWMAVRDEIWRIVQTRQRRRPGGHLGRHAPREVRSWPKAARERSSARPCRRRRGHDAPVASSPTPSMATMTLARRYIAGGDPRAARASPAAVPPLWGCSAKIAALLTCRQCFPGRNTPNHPVKAVTEDSRMRGASGDLVERCYDEQHRRGRVDVREVRRAADTVSRSV